MKVLKGFLLSALVMILFFVLGFFGINIVMKIMVSHRNEVKVPVLVGLKKDYALKKCKSVDLYLQETDYIHSNEIEKDKIISQEPHAGIMTKKYNTINVVISKGPEKVHIPYLDNLSLEEAKLKLENAGLRLGKKVFRYSSSVKKGKVMYSKPSAEETIAKGSKVNVILSLGNLPNSGKNFDKYKNLLDELGD